MKDRIFRLLKEKGAPPPFPQVLISLEKKINDPGCDIHEISVLIESEPILAGKLVTLANSVLFGGGREKVDDTYSAVLRLGIKMVLDLAYSLEMPNIFINQSTSFNHNEFWKHSFIVGYLSRALATKIISSKTDLEITYLAGLLHDLGILIFYHLLGDEYEEFIKRLTKLMDNYDNDPWAKAEINGVCNLIYDIRDLLEEYKIK